MSYRFENHTLTRYLGFSRFVGMLELGLFVPKASLFDDKLEGVLHFASESARPKSVQLAELQALREWSYVSCWYDDHHESHAMWQIYGATHESVAIQTTDKELIKANWTFPERPLTYFDKVRYVDPADPVAFQPKGATVLVNREAPSGFTSIFAAHALFMKHKGYEYEQEMRLVVVDPLATANEQNPATGKYLAPEASRSMIQKIFIHPLAPSWFEDLVRSIATRFELNAPVARSSLSHSSLIAI